MSNSAQNPTVIVTGMHCSGTRLVAAMLSALSVRMGDHLRTAESRKEAGRFEDEKFVRFHRRVLSAASQSDEPGYQDWGWTESEHLNVGCFNEFRDEAGRLLMTRSHASEPSGWEDPRATLFLDQWDSIIEDARYILVYGFPWDVAEAMQWLWIEEFLKHPEYAYRIWDFYNQRVRDFYVKHADRCLLVNMNAVPANLERLVFLLGKLGIGATDVGLAEVVETHRPKSIEGQKSWVEMAAVGNLRSRSIRSNLSSRWIQVPLEGQDPLIDLSVLAWPDSAKLLSELEGLADISGNGLWQPRPVKSRLSRPDSTNGAPVDLSVVTPCYEQGAFLIDAIASVERHAPPNCELIIINDGSRDPRTLEILELLKRCGYFILDQDNAGPSAARNRAIGLARGRYILPVDDDNRIREGFVQEAIEVLASSPKVGVVYGDRQDFGLHHKTQRLPDFDLWELLKHNFIDTCSVLRKQVWVDCGGFDTDLRQLEDWEFWIRAAELGWRFHHLSRVALDYRVRPGSLIKAIDSVDVWEDFCRVMRSKHPDFYWNLTAGRIEAVKSEIKALSSQLAEKDLQIRRLKSEFDSASEITQALRARIAEQEERLGAQDETQRQLAETREALTMTRKELARIDKSYAWFVGRAAVYPAKAVRNLVRSLKSTSARNIDDAQSDTPMVAAEQSQSADEEDDAASSTRIGIVLPSSHLPSKEQREQFLSEFGENHCFIVRKDKDEFHVVLSETEIPTNYDSLPVDYIYKPVNWSQRLSSDHLRNVLLCLSHVALDFVIVSPTLAPLPQVAISSSIRNHLIFSKSLGPNFLENGNQKATGRVLRLLPSEFPVTEVAVDQLVKNTAISYAPDQGRYTPDQGYLFIGQQMKAMSDASASEIRLTQFIPKFKKEKKLVFVLPMVMAVGGVERNAVEVMTQLKDRYQFVVITMDRHDESRGSLHHQLKGLTEAVYDLMELGNLHYYLAFLNDLKHVYEPDAVWICNGMLWLCDHAEHVRRIFHDAPIIDNQAWDAEVGWSEFYHLRGIQSFDRFIATNSRVYRKFVDDLKMNLERIDSIYPCFDSERFGALSPVDEQKAFVREFDLPDDRPIFLFCGRLHSQKGPFDFLELARRRLQKQDDAFFVMRGTGELAPEIDKFIQDHGLVNLRRISFVEDTVPLLSIASGLIITSHYETITIVLLEALSMGLPVLTTDVGDIRLVVEQCQAGLVVPEIGDPDAFEAAYEKWRKDLRLYSAKARQCSAEIRRRFSSASIAEQYSASWERAIREFAVENWASE